MIETEGVLKFPVALSCFAAERMLGVLPLSDREPFRSMRKSLYETGDAAKQEFRTNTMLFGAFQFADTAQSVLANLASDTMTLEVLKPSYVRRKMSDLVQGSTDAFDAVATEAARDRLREQFQNIADVLDFVNHVDAPTSLSTEGTYPLEERLEECYARGDYPALWLVEGLGERYAQAYQAATKDLRDLLTSGQARALPEKSQLMMHAGMGIAFAKHELATLTTLSSETDVKAALARFLDLVRLNSMPGYDGAAIESLGLVTRTWYLPLVDLVSKNLKTLDADAWQFFWHGAGRAMYFSPMYMLPGLSAWEAADQEPPDDLAKLNARAGVAWAFTIVNVRQPAVTEHFLKQKAGRIANNSAYTNGVHSTLVMAGDMVPGHKPVAEFMQFKPAEAVAESWRRNVGTGLRDKIDLYREALRAHRKLGEVFRYHADLDQFVADLDRA